MSQLPPSFRLTLIVPDGSVGHTLRVAQTLGAIVEACDMIEPPHEVEKVKQISPKKGNRLTGVGKAVVAFVRDQNHPVSTAEIISALSNFDQKQVKGAIYTEVALRRLKRNPDRTLSPGAK